MKEFMDYLIHKILEKHIIKKNIEYYAIMPYWFLLEENT
jgi:hypothetical protein